MLKNIKKFFTPLVALLLAFAMLFSVACGNDSNGDKDGQDNNPGIEDPDNPGGGDNTDPNNPGGENPTVTYTVIFMVDGEEFERQQVNSGDTITPPTAPEKDGMMFTGWYESVAATTPYDFTTPVTSNLTLVAKYAILGEGITATGAYYESLHIEFKETSPSSATVEYSLAGENNWKAVDAPLIRSTSSTEARVDILGLAAGSYNVRITLSSGDTVQLPAPVAVSAYDRSGYAHFNYTDGVGAYKDDGTLKEGTLVIYVTEQNKNNVLDWAYVNGQKVDISEYMVAKSAAEGVTVGQQKGIGEMLNNRRYSGNDRMNVGIAKLSQVYGSVAIRIIGTVSAEVSGSMASSINGLTDYDSTGNGGSKGDNGRMARMVNAHDLTIEGVGEDSSIFGWGVHFIASDANHKYKRAGESFEVRNITFENYPEDAIGMEGLQGSKWDENGSITSGASSTSADLPSPVQRCWIHNNTFLPGYAVKPAESDKAEGDGSCDFKRGEYYTLSYNYFEYCHKTNLIGSSDSSLQFNITMHHNWWNQCGSRIPLVRNSNLHFYNNYVSGDMSATPKPDLSYVVSARGSAYMFSEANYFDGTKNVVKEGTVKSYNDTFYADFGTNVATIVTTREATVANSCKFEYRKIDYSHFDTDSTLFYYKNGKSDCLLDDAVTARQKAMMYAGANGHGVSDVAINQHTPDSAVSVGENGTAVALPTAKGDSTVNGILFKGITGVSSGTIKFKGQGITFSLTAQAQLTVATTTTGDAAPELIGSDGTVYAHKFEGTLTIVLEPDTYVIASGQKEKEAVITSMRFDDTAASSELRIAAAVDAINALPATAALTEEYGAALKAAQNAYNALTASEKAAFDTQYASLVTKLNKAADDYGKLLIDNVKALVAAIGTVTKNSYEAINAAQQAYNSLTSDQKAQLTTEKAILDAAWATYEQFAVQNVIDMINAFAAKVENIDADADRNTIEELIAEGENIQNAYAKLSDDNENGPTQQAQVTNYSDLVAAMATLESYNNLYVFIDQLEYFEGHTVTMDDASAVGELQRLYNSLSSAQKNALTAKEKALYNSVIETYNEIASQAIESSFDGEGGSPSNPVFSVSGNSAKNDNYHINGLGGKDFTRGLKMESKTTITFTTTTKMTLTLYVDAAKNINIDGAKVAASQNTDGDYVVVITLEAGAHTVTKADSMNLWYATLMPAA